MTAAERACLALTVVAGSFIGVIELHNTETPATLALVSLFAVLLGFASRRLFWLWAIIVGGSVPAAYVIAAIFRITPREVPQPEGIATNIGVGTVTIATAMIAAAIGAAVAHSASKAA